MECLVFSDTHGNYPLAAAVIMQAGPVEMIFHLGDEAGDAVMLEQIMARKVEKVSGNCDPPGKYPREICTILERTRILMTHGDRYRVKSGLSELHRRAVNANVDVVLYGHTHVASVDVIDGILFVNPGSLQKGNGEKSFARLSIGSNGPVARIITISENSELPDQHPQPQL